MKTLHLNHLLKWNTKTRRPTILYCLLSFSICLGCREDGGIRFNDEDVFAFMMRYHGCYDLIYAAPQDVEPYRQRDLGATIWLTRSPIMDPLYPGWVARAAPWDVASGYEHMYWGPNAALDSLTVNWSNFFFGLRLNLAPVSEPNVAGQMRLRGLASSWSDDAKEDPITFSVSLEPRECFLPDSVPN